jgi:hypothetical protein
VQIISENEVSQYKYYFPRATKLTLADGFSINRHLLATSLTRLMPLKQLKVLVGKCKHSAFVKLIELWMVVSHVETVRYQSITFHQTSRMLVEQSETFWFGPQEKFLCKYHFRRQMHIRQTGLPSPFLSSSAASSNRLADKRYTGDLTIPTGSSQYQH